MLKVTLAYIKIVTFNFFTVCIFSKEETFITARVTPAVF